MVEDHGEIQRSIRTDQAESEERRTGKLEHEGLFGQFLFQLCIRKLRFLQRNFPGKVGMRDHFGSSVLSRLDGALHERMRFDSRVDRICEAIHIGVPVDLQKERNVVFVAGLIHPVFQPDAELCLGKRCR